ncbi:MAG: NUDIX hydrolase [Oligoflexales bacterium]
MNSRTQIITTHAVIVIVLTEGGRFVLVQESKDTCKGQWSPPGGRLEGGEDIFETGLREVAEEAGITVKPLGLLALEHFRYVKAIETPVEKFRHIVLARHLSGRLKDVADAESLCAKAFSLQEAAKLPLRDPNTIKWLELAQSDTSILPLERYLFRTI